MAGLILPGRTPLRGLAGARAFVTASSQVLTLGRGLVAAPPPLTMACWFRTDTVAALEMLMTVGTAASANNRHSLFADGNAGGDPITAQSWVTGAANALTTAGFTANVWHHACAVFRTITDRAAYLNGGSKGTNATSSAPSAPTEVRIGGNHATPFAYYGGRIAHAAIWATALSDAEVAALGKGASPLTIQPAYLVAYWPLGIGARLVEPSILPAVADLTVVGATLAPGLVLPFQPGVSRVALPKFRAGPFHPRNRIAWSFDDGPPPPQSTTVAPAPVVFWAPNVTAAITVTRSVVVAAAVAHAPSVTATPGTVTRTVAPAVMVVSAPSVTPTLTGTAYAGPVVASGWASATGTASISLAAKIAGIVAHAPSVTRTPGTVTRTVAPAVMVVRAPSVTVMAGQLAAVASAPAVIHAPGVTRSVGAVSRSLAAAPLEMHAPAAGVAPGSVTRTAAVGTAVWHAPRVAVVVPVNHVPPLTATADDSRLSVSIDSTLTSVGLYE